MAHIEKSITIQAPVEKVFSYMLEPANYLEFWPSLVAVKDINRKDDSRIGDTFGWVYKMAGLHLEGKSERVNVVPNRVIETRETGLIESDFLWEFEAQDGGTRVNVSLNYAPHPSVFERLAEPVVHRINEHEVDALLKNLKARMEHSHGLS
jgi:uncharacterized membrane protein